MKRYVTWKSYPGVGKEKSMYLYSLDADTIDDVVDSGIPNGNYRIFRRTEKADGTGSYRNIYIGRVADRTSDDGLKDRLKEHIGEWRGDLYFECNSEPTPLAAYQHECRDYHTWKEEDQAEYNSVHPAKLRPNDKCPVCGE